MAFSNYRELLVWQKSMDLVEQVYKLVALLPKDEIYALSSQIRRAAVSIPSNIAEGQGRQYEKEFKHYLSVAKGSLYELETQLTLCAKLKFLNEKDIESVMSLCNEVERMLTKLILSV